MVRGSTYGMVEMKSSLPAEASHREASAEKAAWLSEAHSHFLQDDFHSGNTKTRFNVYYSPKLVYLKVVAISAHALVPSEEGRSLAPTTAKIQLGGQFGRTNPGLPQGSANLIWNNEFLLVVSEPLEDPLVVTVEERVGPERYEPIGSVVIPISSDLLAKSVTSKWFNLSHGLMLDELAADVMSGSKIHLRLSLETEYHVLT